MRKIKILRNLSNTLKSSNNILWFLIYIGTILFFTILYCFIPNHFYHSTITYERSVDSEYHDLKTGIEKAVKDEFLRYYNHDSIYLNDEETVLFNIYDLNLNHLFFDDDGKLILSFGIYSYQLDTISHSDEKSTVAQFYENIDLKFNNHTSYDYNSETWTLYFEHIDIDMPIYDVVDSINSNLIFSTNSINQIPVITIPTNLSEDIRNYQQALLGFPHKIQGKFGRMFYLSMVTITTLGYGDIVPLTNCARILVGVESVLGIIILGLFINSSMKKVKANDKVNTQND